MQFMDFAIFLSTLPARGATTAWAVCLHTDGISIHAPREGSDPGRHPLLIERRHFYPRSPRGERLSSSSQISAPRNFYPRSPRGERRPPRSRLWIFPTYFYPRSPRGERRRYEGNPKAGKVFLSTLPARGATAFKSRSALSITKHFYPRSPRGERRMDWPTLARPLNFYPRSPRGERPRSAPDMEYLCEFLSTLPARGATGYGADYAASAAISIHAPREGSDGSLHAQTLWQTHFYPRSPRGERRGVCQRGQAGGRRFLSTLPARGAT